MNVFTFSGNLGRDCRVNQVSGTSVCNFAVAVTSGYGDNKQTNWIDCALWGKQAESKLPDYLLKGKKVIVSGELGTREHEGKTYLTCRVNSVDLAGDFGSSGGDQPQPARQPVQNTTGLNAKHPNPADHKPDPNRHTPNPDDIDDDIPF